MNLDTGVRVLDRYDVEERLGAGGMGEVWRARHVHLGTRVALKVLRYEEDEELLHRFTREARFTAAIRHPNVVGVLDFGMLDGGMPCLVMELLDGEPLDRRLADRDGSLPLAEALAIGGGILAGLDAIHAGGILHRDLKPSNVFLCAGAAGQPETVKLIDFGIARPVSEDATRLTKTGATIGTPAYMSPEQMFGFPLDIRSDVYTAGLVLYQLLAGTLPFGGMDMQSALDRMQKPIPPPVAPAGRPPVPPGVAAALVHALEREPVKRPASARELATALAHGAANLAGSIAPTLSAAVLPGAIAVPTLAPAAGVAPEALRYLLAAKIPPSRMAAAADRQWLASTVAPSGRGFFLGAHAWFALQAAPSDRARASAAVETLAASLRERYGSAARVQFTLVDGAFALSAAALAGAAPLPPALTELLGKLSGA